MFVTGPKVVEVRQWLMPKVNDIVFIYCVSLGLTHRK